MKKMNRLPHEQASGDGRRRAHCPEQRRVPTDQDVEGHVDPGGEGSCQRLPGTGGDFRRPSGGGEVDGTTSRASRAATPGASGDSRRAVGRRRQAAERSPDGLIRTSNRSGAETPPPKRPVRPSRTGRLAWAVERSRGRDSGPVGRSAVAARIVLTSNGRRGRVGRPDPGREPGDVRRGEAVARRDDPAAVLPGDVDVEAVRAELDRRRGL